MLQNYVNSKISTVRVCMCVYTKKKRLERNFIAVISFNIFVSIFQVLYKYV